jgi:hypothetical protein
LEFVTIIHPYHPLNGQQVEVVRVLRGPDPDLIVRHPDGRHAAISMSLTSYANPQESKGMEARLHLLDLDGLHQIVAFLDALQVPTVSPALPGKGEALKECTTDPSRRRE